MTAKKPLYKLPEVTPELVSKVAAACRAGCKGDGKQDLFMTCVRTSDVSGADVTAVAGYFFPSLRDDEPLPIAALLTAIGDWLSLEQAA